ncbi:MAG: enoyl-CoA hydratase/isomerase family protein [Bernardetiaceae bacterium]
MAFSSFSFLRTEEAGKGLVILTFSRGRSNPMNAQVVSELRQAFQEAATAEDCRAVVLAGQENFFSVGLDVIELYGYDEAEITSFWQNFLALLEDMLRFPKPLVAAITGHSPAGGCVLAIGCDYRVMAEGKFQIGLNEIPVGIMLPESIFEVYRFWIGSRKAYQYLMEGKLLTPEEAAEVGLVDALVPAEQVIERAIAQAQMYMRFEPSTWRKSKANLRRDLLQRMSSSEAHKAAQLAESLAHWWSPAARQVLGGLVKHLSQKSPVG